MAKQIFDVLPPKLAHKVENTIRELGGVPKKSRHSRGPSAVSVKSSHKPISHKKKQGRFPLMEISIGGVVIVLLLAIYFYTTLPKATIEISPKLTSVDLQEKVKADTAALEVNMVNRVIPAQYMEEQKDGSQDFAATGNGSNEGKAAGTIKIYNKINPASPLSLKAGTHFLSDSGKYFVTTQKVTVPEAASSKTPGSIEVKIEAEESGTDYNIGPSKFSVPKLSGTTYYYSIWAESTAAMQGGYTGQVKKVTQGDLDTSKDALTQNLINQAIQSLKSKLSNDDIILDDATTKTVIASSASLQVGAVADSFTQTAKVKVSALVFKKSDLEKIARNDIIGKVAEGQNLWEESVTTDYTIDSIDTKNQIETLATTISAKTYPTIDNADIVNSVSGKTGDQIGSVLGANDAISQFKVNFWPFWVTSAPKNKNRIIINRHFE